MIVEAPHYLKLMTEAQWQALIREAADVNGWIVYHTRDSRGSDKGFFDLVIAREGFACFWELKTETGKIRPEQQRWHDVFKTLYGPFDVGIYRPRDWDYIARILDNPWGEGQLMLGANPRQEGQS